MILVGPNNEATAAGFSLIPNPPEEGINLFSGTLKTDAEAARDAYFTSNPDQLARYDSNSFLLIQIKYTSPAPVFEFELRSAGSWVNAFGQAVSEVALATHSVTELLDVSSAGSGQIITVAEREKLAGIQVEATKNQTDSYLLDRTNHTGEQEISTVVGLSGSLAGKSGTNHEHSLTLSGDVSASGALGPTSVDLVVTVQDNSHLHTVGNVTGLQTSLDNKSDINHVHNINGVTGLQPQLDSKSNVGHGHVVSDVSGLQTALDNKANVIHSHPISAITDLQTTLDSKSPVGHNHSISQVTNLQSSLDSKQDKINGLAVHRFIQVSNGANSTITTAGGLTTSVLPLLATGSFNDGFNNPSTYGSLSLANNWIDVRGINRNADVSVRITASNNAGGSVNNAVFVLRLIPDIAIPTTFTEILSTPESFTSSASIAIRAYAGDSDAIQIGVRTQNSENVRLNGVYVVFSDVLVYP